MNVRNEPGAPVLSIITVCRNAGRALSETVASFADAIGDDLEAVIQDCVSSDDSIARIQEIWGDRLRVERAPDSGIYDGMNRALQRAAGKYVIFLNAGDRFSTRDDARKVIDKLKADARADIVILSLENLLEGVIYRYPAKPSKYFLYRNFYCHQAQVWRRETLIGAGGFSAGYAFAADYDVFLKAYNSGVRVEMWPVAQVSYADRGVSSLASTLTIRKAEHAQVRRARFTTGELIAFQAFEFLTLKPLRMWLYARYRTTRGYRIYRKIVDLVDR